MIFSYFTKPFIIRPESFGAIIFLKGVVLNENKDLLTSIAEYLIKVETLTRVEIEEICATGKLSWYENKMKKAEEKPSSFFSPQLDFGPDWIVTDLR